MIKGSCLEQILIIDEIEGLTIEYGVVSALIKLFIQQKIASFLDAKLVLNEVNIKCKDFYSILGFEMTGDSWRLSFEKLKPTKFFGSYKLNFN
jgi:hypothetical protein